LDVAKYLAATSPKSKTERETLSPTKPPRDRWRRLGAIAQRVENDDTSSESSADFASLDSESRVRTKEARRREKKEREKYARHMGLEYFLEMVDTKHRYGSNLRRYHEEWKRSDTHENFFYWLDYGEGKDLDLEDRPRKRLDTEQVRYLSREERKNYQVQVDDKGLFRWCKDGELVTTSAEYRDSVEGIVPVDDPAEGWKGVRPEGEVETQDEEEASDDEDETESLSGASTGSHPDASKYTNSALHDAKGPVAKLHHLSVDTLMNHLLRKTTKKNTWIFVADTSFRLYIGIKQSGSFQHSSFLKGARVAAAGLIKIKRGQLRKLSPLSGHYAPPVHNFRMFVRQLKKEGADLSRCSISRSYAVIMGLEGYLQVKGKVKHAERAVKEVLRPEERERRKKALEDGSQSARREREVLELQQQQQMGRRERGWSGVLGLRGKGGEEQAGAGAGSPVGGGRRAA
jgi:hypothetical protein